MVWCGEIAWRKYFFVLANCLTEVVFGSDSGVKDLLLTAKTGEGGVVSVSKFKGDR